MNLIKVLKKLGMQFSNLKEKEVSKMTKKIMAIAVVMAVTLMYTAAPAMAYTSLATPVAITASGTLAGVTVAFSATLVTAPSGSAATTVDFTSPAGITNSGEAIKITAATNDIGNRIIIYTDNANNTVSPEKASTMDPNKGVDGAGLVGRTNSDYGVAMFWATSNTPNTLVSYTFGNPSTPADGATTNCVYIVDKRHTMSFTTPSAVATSLDCKELYKLDGTLVPNVDNDGLYPQAWGYDLYDSPTVHTEATRVSPALYGSIATIAHGISQNIDTTTPTNSSYVCNTPNLVTYSPTTLGDTITAKLLKYGSGTTDNYIYVYLGADFAGKPAQVYSTAKLYVELVKD